MCGAEACKAGTSAAGTRANPHDVPAAVQDVPNSRTTYVAEAHVVADQEQPQHLGVCGRTSGSNELQAPPPQQAVPTTEASPFTRACHSREGQQPFQQLDSPRAGAIDCDSGEAAAHAHLHTPQPAADANRPQPSTAARRSSRAKSEAVSAAAVSASPAAAMPMTQHQHHSFHRGHGSLQVGHIPRGDLGAHGSIVNECAEVEAALEAAALRHEEEEEAVPPVPEAEPEPQPAACTVPLQPPQLTASQEPGPRTSRRSPAPQASDGLLCAPGASGEAGEAHLGAPRGHEDEEDYGEVQQGGKELSVEQGRLVEGRREEEGDGERRGVPVGRADAMIGDGIVGGEDLEMKLSVEMGMEVNCGWDEGSAEQDMDPGGAQDDDVPGGGRADAVIMLVCLT
jgi:hypothetical protein